MAHYALLNDSNTVIRVVAVSNNELMDGGVENSAKGVSFLESLFGRGAWVQTSYSGSFRKQFAGEGYSYDPVADVFIAPQPFPSWTLDASFNWQPPVQRPEGVAFWDEETRQWKAN